MSGHLIHRLVGVNYKIAYSSAKFKVVERCNRRPILLISTSRHFKFTKFGPLWKRLGSNICRIESKDREAFRTLVESVVQMTTFISQIFLKLVELQFKVPISAE